MSRAVPVCPHCLDESEAPIVCDRCGWRWYANPRPAAAVLLERGDGDEAAVLLLRRAVEPGAGGWDLPAGYLDPGESFEQAARRETREEAGLEVQRVELAGVYHAPPAHAGPAGFRARALDPDAEVRVDFESSTHAWVVRREVAAWLPRIAFESMASAVADWSRRETGDA